MTNFLILIDTREKDPHIQKELSVRGIPFVKQKLNYGDYSFEYNNISYETQCVVERKNSINEIIVNFTKGRSRFEREFKRAKGCNVHLMIEATEDDIKNHNYRSTMPPRKVKSFIQTWSYKFGLNLKFVSKDKATDFILNTFEEFVKE